MPIATIVDPTQHFDLKSLPGAYVVLRRMTWGERVKMQSTMAKFSLDMSNKDAEKVDVDFKADKVVHWEFSNLIVEHNLTDETERPLNFRNLPDIDRLSPVVGEEIKTRIDELNSFEEDKEVKN